MRKTCLWAVLAFVPSLLQAQLLKGTISGTEVKEVSVAYCPSGDIMETQYKDVPVTEGKFEFDVADMPVDETDVQLYVGRSGVLGAHLTKGKTLQMDIKAEGRKLSAEFTGYGADVSRFYSRYAEAYDIMRYFSLDPETKQSTAGYLKLLADEYAAVKALLPGIENAAMRDFYSRLNDSKYRNQQSRILSDSLYDAHVKPADNAEYQALVAGVDVNDEVHRLSGLALTALLTEMNENADFKGDMAPYCLEIIKLTNEKVTNPKFRRELVNTVGYNYFTFGDGSGDNQGFWKAYTEFAGTENADIPKRYEAKMASYERLKRGAEAADITLTDRQGKTVQLSDVVKGKFTYIDVWATWCGPCVAEIPHLEKLVEKLKDDAKVQFISISIDENVKAWEKKIDTDKPQWAQYNIHGDVAKQFSQDWGITGIPRFIMIDAEGNIFSADATRPSDSSTEQTIVEQAHK